MSNRCIRIFADIEQIRQCKEDLSMIQQSVSRLAKILDLAGNEVRLKILYLIDKESEMCPCDLSDIFNMTVPAVSQHLRKLKDGGLVSNKKVGQTVFYSLIKESQEVIHLLESLSVQDRKETKL
jgi:DNA-binding transcriptional ArsR family regulator